MYDLKLALNTAKAFTANRRIKVDKAMIVSIRGAYVTPEYVYATDSKILIRIQHNSDISDSYVHFYNKDDEPYYKKHPKPFPPVERIMPKHEHATWAYNILDSKEWRNIHDMAALIKGNNTIVTMDMESSSITTEGMHKTHYGITTFSYTDLPLERIPFTRTFAKKEFPKLNYNNDYMLTGLKAFSKLKMKSPLQLAIYEDAFKPFLLSGEGVDVIIMPTKKEHKVPEAKSS